MGILKMGAIYGRNQEEIHGRSAHGSAPDQGKDAIVAAAAVVMGLQTLSSRVNNPQNTFVLTVGMMNGGTQSNIIADEVELVGTTRAFDKAFRKSLPQWGRLRNGDTVIPETQPSPRGEGGEQSEPDRVLAV